MSNAQTIVQLLEQMRDRPLPERQAVRRGYEFAIQLFAGRYRACGRPFVSHLIGTASALVRLGAPIDLVLAGLLHAAYEQGVFTSRRDRRGQLRRALGDPAEQLVHEYQNFKTSRVPDDIGEEHRNVVMLRIANEFDECGDRGMLYVGPKKREGVIAGIPKYITAARRYGWPEIADELEAVLAQVHGEPEPGLAESRDGSFTLSPPLRTILRARLKTTRRALKRKLGFR